MKSIETIVIIGAGNVAVNLAKALQLKGKKILQVYSRTEQSAASLAQIVNAAHTTNIKDIVSGADLYIVSVSDEVLPLLASQINVKNSLLVHTSGSLPIDVLNNSSENIGVFYPLQSFRKEFLSDFQNIPLLLEGNKPEVLDVLTSLANELSGSVYSINSDQRKWVHLGAVFACNFSNYMSVIAEDILAKHNIPFQILLPLIQQTAQRIENASPALLQTGPAIRKDYNVMQKHIECLKNEPEYEKIYKLISDSIMMKFNN